MNNQFSVFADAVHQRFNRMSQGELFVVETGDLFATYLNAFPEGTNPIFRVRTEHDCSCCKNFIRNVGNVVCIEEDGSLGTVWDIDGLPEPYGNVAVALADIIRQQPIAGVFRTKQPSYGAEVTIELVDSPTLGSYTKNWNHFHGQIDRKHRCAEPDAIRGSINTSAAVLRRGLEELSFEALTTVKDLIEDNAIYRGAENLTALSEFRELKRAYDSDNPSTRDALVWSSVGARVARFRNTAIGSLVTDLSDGIDIEKAVRSFESKVAPENYKRPKALITKKMIESAMGKIKELGLENSLERRYAYIEDVSVNDVIFVDGSSCGAMLDGAAVLEAKLNRQAVPQKISSRAPTTISVADFTQQVVPGASTLGLIVENRHLPNFVSLTAARYADAPPLFRWPNRFAWSYDGDTADSLKQRVKTAGGNIQADLRISLGWFNYDDLDIHCRAPGYPYKIGFDNKQGVLDVDMNAGSGSTREAVENLAFMKPKDGVYKIFVDNYCRRESIDIGFILEVESGGAITTFHAKKSPTKRMQPFLDLKVNNGVVQSISTYPGIEKGNSSQEKWNVQTETITPVETILLSPNHWKGNSIGNKHWFFILKNCKRPDEARGIYNEFLRTDLEEHRKVFEVLGGLTKCPPSDRQLSGVGFSSTRKDEAQVVVDGQRAYKIQF